jgi:hypothetical protein
MVNKPTSLDELRAAMSIVPAVAPASVTVAPLVPALRMTARSADVGTPPPQLLAAAQALSPLELLHTHVAACVADETPSTAMADAKIR